MDVFILACEFLLKDRLHRTFFVFQGFSFFLFSFFFIVFSKAENRSKKDLRGGKKYSKKENRKRKNDYRNKKADETLSPVLFIIGNRIA